MNQIDVLPDDALLEIFDFYVDKRRLIFHGVLPHRRKASIEAWQVLVHVCRRWRSLVLGSPRRLNLRLYYLSVTPIKDTLDAWPAFPLVVDSGIRFKLSSSDNIIAALRHSNRICEVNFCLIDTDLEGVLAAMQVPFPELTDLWISSPGIALPIIPNSFLGGSAPRLRSFKLGGALFPGLPELLLSATHLVELGLFDIYHSGHIPPEAAVAIISVLSSLRTLSLLFRPHHDSRPVSDGGSRPPKPSILPALENFHFRGTGKYLEGLVTRIDAPQLDEMHLTFFNQTNYDCSQLAQFINRSPRLRVCDEARVLFSDFVASVELRAQHRTIKIEMSCREPDRQLSSAAQVCNSPMHPISMVENLYFVHPRQRLFDTFENGLWLELLLPFTAVMNLYLSKEIAPGIAAVMQELVGGRTTEVLPSLENIFVERLKPTGSFKEKTGPFVAARQLSDHPVAISNWDKN